MNYKDASVAALRVGMGAAFAYFGALALLNPAQQQAIWVASWVQALPVIGHPGFIVFVGTLEVVVAAALILGLYVRYAALAGAGLLLGIVVNLGFGELAIRDAVLLLGCLVLATHEHRYALRP